jgi:hypothetical protein
MIYCCWTTFYDNDESTLIYSSGCDPRGGHGNLPGGALGGHRGGALEGSHGEQGEAATQEEGGDGARVRAANGVPRIRKPKLVISFRKVGLV